MEAFCKSVQSMNLSDSIIQSSLNQSRKRFESARADILKNQRLPETGWSDACIEAFLLELSGMDGNNFVGTVGLGEREGRIYSNLVKNRHYGFSHGMGRSGNLKDGQPKAVGSTILACLTEKLLVSALRTVGFHKKVLEGGLQIMPVCTGMSIALALMAVQSPYSKKVIWLRIDQKSCFKAVLAANLEPIIIEGKYVGDEIVTDLDAILRVIEEHEGRIHSIVSCVTCFAPRAPDFIVQISQIAAKYSISHIVNSAYGGSSEKACNLINAATDAGRIDAVIMSLDKNFMVPVGGAIIFGPNKEFIERIGKRYAGRAGISHVIDIFITLLGMGQNGILKLKEERIKCFQYFRKRIMDFCIENPTCSLNLLHTPKNDISMALQLDSEQGSSIGSELFYRNISGIRVIDTRISQLNGSKITRIDGFDFKNFGAHLSVAKERIYLNVAAAVGSEERDIVEFFKKFNRLRKRNKTKQ